MIMPVGCLFSDSECVLKFIITQISSQEKGLTTGIGDEEVLHLT